ncbi:phage tail spike protein [Enterococcus sp. DIV0876]|uniref:phage tail spike protein n=1 Tax=Enterococcus sp. DIV0876 TaxID=2774633 RepID=UPI003D2FC6E3
MTYPILYEANETDFFSLGLGPIKTVTEAFVTEERNGSFILEGKVLVDDEIYPLLQENRIIKADASPKLTAQRFRIKRIVPDHEGKAEIYAEHVSYLSQELPMKPEVTINGNGTNAINVWKSSILDSNPFIVDSDISTIGETYWRIDKVENPRQALGGVEGSILDVWGGEYRFDNYHISLLKKRGTTANTILAYGRNITDFEQERNIMKTYTTVYPFAIYTDDDENEQIITIDGYVVDCKNINEYPNRNVLPVDFSNEFEHDEVPTKAKLKQLAQDYIQNNEIGIPKTSIKVSFLDLSQTADYADVATLETVELCDDVRVYYQKLGVDTIAKVIRTKWNVIREAYDEIEIGEKRTTLSTIINDTQTSIKEIENQTGSAIIAANGKNMIFYGLFGENGLGEPVATRVGDMWYKPNGEDTEFYIWNGAIWEFIMSTGKFVEIDKAIEDAKKAGQDAQLAAEGAKEAADDAQAAGESAQAAANEAKEAGDAALEKVAQAEADIAAANEKIGQHTIDLSKLFEDFANSEAVIDQIVIDTGEMNTAISENADKIVSVQTEANNAIAANAADILTAQSKANDAYSKAQAVEGTTQTIIEDVEGITSTMTKLETDVDSTTKTLNEVRTTVDGQTQTIATVKTTADAALSKSNTNSNTIDGIETTLTATKTTADSALTKANSAQSTADGNSSKITATTTTANTALNTANTAKSTADGNSSKITAITTTANSALNKANTLEETVDGVTRNITSIQEDLSKVEEGRRNILINSSLYSDGTRWGISGTLNAAFSGSYVTLNKTTATPTRLTMSQNVFAISPEMVKRKTSYSIGIWYYIENLTTSTANTVNVFLRSSYGSTYKDSPSMSLDVTESGVWKLMNLDGISPDQDLTGMTFTIAFSESSIIKIRLKEAFLVMGKNIKDWEPNPLDLATVTKVNSISDTVDGHAQLIATTKTTADSALTKANSAQSTADGNTSKITSVQTTAESALNKANITEQTVDGMKTTLTSVEKNTANWNTYYQVNTATPKEIKELNGAGLDDRYMYEISAQTLSTGSITRLLVRLKPNQTSGTGGQGWTLELLDQLGTGSNHPRIYLDEATGKPMVTLWNHASLYNVFLTITKSVSTINQGVYIEQTVEGVKQTISVVKETAESAVTKANTAQSTADGNTSKIVSVTTTANSALSKANNLEETVDGVTRTISSVQEDLSSFGGRNLLVRTGELVNKGLGGNGTNPGTTTVVYPVPVTLAGASTMKEAIKVTAGKKYTFQKTGTDNWRYNWLDKDYAFISRSVPTESKFTVTAPNGAEYLWVSYPTIAEVKIEEGSIATGFSLAPEDSATTAKVNTISDTVDGHTQLIASTTTTANSALSKATTTEATVNGLKTTVSAVETTANSALTKATAVETTANGLTVTVGKIANGGSNLFTNGGFENEFIGWTTASGFTIDSTEKHSGSNALKIDNTGSMGRAIGQRVNIPVTPGRKYEVSYWVKTTADADGISGNQKLRIAKSDGSLINSLGWDGPLPEWTQIKQIYTVGSGIFEWKVTLTASHKVGTVWWDDVSVVDVTDREETAAQLLVLSNEIDLRVQKNGVINAINVSTEGIIIAGNKITITGQTSIENGVIKTAHIADLAVSTAKIANLSVAEGKIANLAVTNAKIANLAVTEVKIGDAAITTAKIGNLAVSTAKIADGAIVNAKIGDAAITNAKIADASISSAKIINLDASKIVASSLSAITANTGTLNVTGWINIQTDNNGIRASYDYGDQLDGTYNPRWFTGEYVLGYRYHKFLADVYNLNSNGTKGSFRNYAETFIGGDYFKLRQYDNKTSKNLLGRIDMTGGRLEINDSFHDGQETGIHLWGNGYSWFEQYATFSNGMYVGATNEGKAIETGRIDAPSNYATLKINNNRALNDITFGELNTYFNETRLSSADFRIGVDGDGKLIQSTSVYNRTYSSSSNMVVQSTGTIGRSTSASKYKLNITEVEDAEDMGMKLLTVNPKYWFDKHGSEMAALDITEGGLDDIDPITLKPHYGLIAEDLRGAGLDAFISTNYDTGEIEGIEYDRLWVTLLPLIKKLVEKNVLQEVRLNKLERLMEGLVNG